MPERSPEAARPPIIQYWHSEQIPDYIAERLATLAAHNPDRPHLVFSEQTAAQLIAKQFGDRHLSAFNACAVPAMQADYFRYCAVCALGGAYVDADMTCVNSLRSIFENQGFLVRWPGGPVLNGLFAFAEPGHPFMAMSVEVATGNIERRASEHVSLTTGPMVFSGLVRLHELGSLELVRESVESRWKDHVDACWDSLSASLREAVADCDGLERALEGVRIADYDEGLEWLRNPEFELPYKYGPNHWENWQSTIFRSADVVS